MSVIPSSVLLQPGDTVTIWAFASDNAAVETFGLQIDGVPVTLGPAGSVEYTVMSPGLVEVVGTATDTSGNVGTGSRRLRVVDPTDTTPPFVEIASPASNATITYLTDIHGTVTDPSFELYRLQYALAGTEQWVTFAEGAAEVRRPGPPCAAPHCAAGRKSGRSPSRFSADS